MSFRASHLHEPVLKNANKLIVLLASCLVRTTIIPGAVYRFFFFFEQFMKKTLFVQNKNFILSWLLPVEETARVDPHYSVLGIDEIFCWDTVIEQVVALSYNFRGHTFKKIYSFNFKFLDNVSIEASRVCAMHMTQLKLETKLDKQKQFVPI